MIDFHRNVMLPIEQAPCVIERPEPRLPDFERPADPQLAAEGWERRFMADAQRLDEYIQLYQSLGYEVRTEIVRPDEIGAECGDCRLFICRQFVTLYTRRRAH